MIDHDLRCIFVHIPRCGGSSIEKWLCGRNWWSVEPSTKHLTASQARRIYEPWWDDYFKFAVVRDPYSRTRPLLKYAEYFGLRKEPGKPIDFSGYEALFGRDLVIEYDYRFAQPHEVANANHRRGCVYGNILDQPLDFIGKFENLAMDMSFVQHRLKLTRPFDVHVERSDPARQESLTQVDRLWVAAKYAEDFRDFSYDD